jgi:hypothetical protein
MESPTDLAKYHDLAGYRCGEQSIALRTNTDRFLCGYSSELPRAFNQFSWQWEPDYCHLPGRFGAEMDKMVHQFLEKARSLKIVFIGDSLSYQQFLSLRCMFGKEVLLPETSGFDFYLPNGIEVHSADSPFLVNKTTLQIMHERVLDDSLLSDFQESSKYLANKRLQRDFALSLLEDDFNWETYKNPDGSPYTQYVQDSQAVLVLNTGPHWHGNIKGYGTMVLNVLRFLKREFKGKRVFYRASGHAHTGCLGASSPQTIKANNNDSMAYNYRLLEHYNAIWNYEIARLKDDRFVYLDVFPMSRDRADSHSTTIHNNDCLHFCLPGVVDFWNLLLISFIVYGG